MKRPLGEELNSAMPPIDTSAVEALLFPKGTPKKQKKGQNAAGRRFLPRKSF